MLKARSVSRVAVRSTGNTMTVSKRLLIALLMPFLWVAVARASSLADKHIPDAAQLEFFEKQVRPLFAKHCYECHSVSAKRVEANLLLDSRTAQLHGGDSGAVIVPGDADNSLLIAAVRYVSYEMPPQGKLSEGDVETLVRWVNMGAPWPQEVTPTANADRESFDLEQRKSEH